MLEVYVLDNFFEPLHTIAADTIATTGLNLCECTARISICNLKIYSYFAIQEPYLSSKNIAAAWYGPVIMKSGRLLSGQTLHSLMNLASLSVLRRISYVFGGTRDFGSCLNIESQHSTLGTKRCQYSGLSSRLRTPLFRIVGTFNTDANRAIADNHIVTFMYSIMFTEPLHHSYYRRLPAGYIAQRLLLLIYQMRK